MSKRCPKCGAQARSDWERKGDWEPGWYWVYACGTHAHLPPESARPVCISASGDTDSTATPETKPWQPPLRVTKEGCQCLRSQIARQQAILDNIDFLRAQECWTVEICADNADFNADGRDSCVRWHDCMGERHQSFFAETMPEALQKARDAVEATQETSDD